MRRYAVTILIVMVAFSLTGCLVADNSTTFMSEKEDEEIEIQSSDLAEKFLIYNSYASGDEYPYLKLVELFNQENLGTVVTLDYVSGGSTDKQLTDLYEPGVQEDKGELVEQNTIFGEQPDSYKLFFYYNIDENSFDVEQYTSHYRIKFVVREQTEINGNQMSESIVTDNGYINFTLTQKIEGWKIDNMKIDFKEPGTISAPDTLEAVEADDEWHRSPKIYYLKTEVVGSGGRIELSTTQVEEDDKVNIEAIPDEGYTFAGWSYEFNNQIKSLDRSQKDDIVINNILTAPSFEYYNQYKEYQNQTKITIRAEFNAE